MPTISEEIQSALPTIEREFWWHKARRDITESLFFTHHPNKNQKILSVGCSTGAEIEFLEKFGQVTAIDVDDAVIEQSRQKGHHVIKGDITKISASDIPSNSFDIIVAMDVIEHIPDHKAAIYQLHRLLKPTGQILITVPALMALWSAFDEYGPFPHQRRYNKNTLTALISPHFKIKKISHYNFFLFPLIYLNRKLSKNPVAQNLMPHPIINTTLYKIFGSEKFFLPRLNFPIGGSLIAIAQKQ